MDRWMTRLVIGVVALLAGSIALLAGVGFLCAALYLGLLGIMPAPAAAAATGIAAFLVAVLCVLMARLISSALNARGAERREAGAAPGAENALALELTRILGNDLIAFAAARPMETIAVSLASGFAIGAFPSLRHALRGALGER